MNDVKLGIVWCGGQISDPPFVLAEIAVEL